MKNLSFFKILILLGIMGFSISHKPVGQANADLSGSDFSPFLGKWTLDISPSGVGWIEIHNRKGYPDADLLWGGGSVLPVLYIYVSEDVLYVGHNTSNVVRETDETGKEIRVHHLTNWLELKRDQEYLTGVYKSPNRNGNGISVNPIKGTKLPDVPPAPDLTKVKYGKPINLIAENDLSGWKLVDDNKRNGWSVRNGILINDPVLHEGERNWIYGNLRTNQEFEDFNLRLEVNVPPGSNSGVYIRGMFEVQVLDSYGTPPSSHTMGALYSRIAPAASAEKPAGEWQTMDITYCDRHLTVILNEIKIIDNQPVYGPTGGALSSDVFAPGPVFLQGDHGKILYRNIVLTPIRK